MNHILTVNVEDYFQVGAFSHLIPVQEWDRFENRIRRNLEITLGLLEQYGASATFFLCGWVAEKHPEVLRDIVGSGHELGAQTYYQQPISAFPPAAFRDDIQRSKALLEDLTGRQVSGFRIGRGWLDPGLGWPFEMIAAAGFVYDSSVCPRGWLRASKPALLTVHEMQLKHRKLVELPISTWPVFACAIPFAGGNYLRQLPLWFIEHAFNRWAESRTDPLVAYFHSWELDRTQPEIAAAGLIQRLRHYRNLDVMRHRLKAMLSSYTFVSAARFLEISAPRVVRNAPERRQEGASSVGTVEHSAQPTRMTLVIPCYNEEESIPYLKKTLSAFVERARGSLVLSYVFVDDGSTDATWQRLRDHFGDYDNAQLVRLDKNQGIATAILTGARNANDDLVAVIDADCTFDPVQLLNMLPHVKDGVDVVVASPFHTSGSTLHVPPWRLLLSRGATMLYRGLMRNKLTSYTSCFRIYRRELIAEMEVSNGGFCGITEILARLDLENRTVVEVPAVLQVRLLGQSKIRLLQVIGNHLRLLAKIFAARFLAIDLL